MPSSRALLPVLLAALALGAGGCDGDPSAQEATEILRARTQGMALLQQDRLPEARAAFRRLAELAPGEAVGPANLALVSLREGSLEEAEALARDAVSRAPEDAPVRLVLAAVLDARGLGEEARTERERALAADSTSLQALWALAGGASDGPGYSVPEGRGDRLEAIVALAPSSVPARMERAEFLLARGDADGAARELETVRSLVPTFPPVALERYEEALSRAREGNASAALGPTRALHERLRLDPLYQGELERLRGPLGEATGRLALAFSHELRMNVPDESAVLAALRFRDAGAFAQLDGLSGNPGPPGSFALGAAGDLDGDGDQDLVAWIPAGTSPEADAPILLLRNDLGRFVNVTPGGLSPVSSLREVVLADIDGNGFLDVYLVREGANGLLRNRGDWDFREEAAEAGVDDPGAGRAAVFVDLDHDADLDLVVANASGLAVLGNDGVGRFTPSAEGMGLAQVAGVSDLGFADADDDGYVDLFLARGGDGLALARNAGQAEMVLVESGMSPVTAAAGLVDALAVGDVDNDGFPDVVTVGAGGAPVLRTGGDRGSYAEALPLAAPPAAVGSAPPSVLLLDVDNDGRLDVAYGGADGTVILRNEGGRRFQDRTDELLAGGGGLGGVAPARGGPAPRTGAGSVPGAVLDYNEDGDLDLLVLRIGGVGLLRNDGGNVNHNLALSLMALGAGSGKVNRFAVGSLVEVVAGDLYQSRTVRGPLVHFGLGSRLKADVIRVLWTNGVPQYLYFPGTDQDLLESQELKGSCAFVYAWNGEEFAFVTDATWKSALGMPLGIMGGGMAGGERIYAPAASSREFVRIPGEALKPRNGRYTLQITEELWEVAYMDEVKLLAVDHPASVEFFVDEKFVPPAPPRLELYHVADRRAPVSARDERGQDVLPALRELDDRYVSDFRPAPYQGLVEPHALVLELPREVASAGDPHLFLQGWIFPSDASINVAVSQRDGLSVQPSRLEVPDGDGGWTTVVPDIGFPSGKNKTVVVPLAGRLNRDDPRVRIATNMQVYWDRAFFAAGGVRGPSLQADAEAAARLLPGPGGEGADVAGDGGPAFRTQLLRPVGADLHYRGFSREYRKGGRFGPHWFDYGDVSPESPWLPIRGRYTRYGEVTPLVQGHDDRYVIMAPGDEMTVDFDAGVEPVPEGWTRTFLLYTDGWIKDADLNTATGQTVAPLPFHGQATYPWGPGDVPPDDPAYRAFLEEYQTRIVGGTTRGLAPERP